MEPEPLDPVAEVLAAQVDDECPTCGAYVLNPALHRDWHGHLRAALNDLGRRADAYKDPPRYGGAYR